MIRRKIVQISINCCGDCPQVMLVDKKNAPDRYLKKPRCKALNNREMELNDLFRTIPDWCPLEDVP